MLPVMPTTSGVNRARQAAATAWSARSVSGTSITVTSPSVSRAGSPAAGSGPRETRMAAAPAAAAAARNRWPSVRSPGRATNRLPGATRRESTAAPRIRRSLRRRSRPPVAASRSSAVRAGSGAGGRPGSVTASSVAQAALTGGPRRPGRRVLVGDQVGRVDRVVGDAPEQLEGHDRHLEVAEPDDRRRPLLDPDRDHEVRPAGLPRDVADERVVEQVDLPGLLLVVPDLGRAGLAADLEARDQRPGAVEVHLGDDVVHELREGRRRASRTSPGRGDRARSRGRRRPSRRGAGPGRRR